MEADASGLLLVHAHPDDEAFGTGGLIARSVAEGRRVDLVTCTGGEEGEIHDPTLDTTRPSPACARSARRAAVRAGRAARRRPGHAGAAPAGLPRLRDDGHRVERTSRRLLERGPGRGHRPAGGDRAAHAPAVMVSYDSNGNYGHPDHINAYRIADAAWEAAADGRYPEAGPPHPVGKLYEIAFNRDRWMALMNDMKERGIELPWGGRGVRSRLRDRRGVGRQPGPAHDRAGRRRLGRAQAAPAWTATRPSARTWAGCSTCRPTCRPAPSRPSSTCCASGGTGRYRRATGRHRSSTQRSRVPFEACQGSIGLDEALNDYILRVGVREHPVLARLRERTSTMENAQMQIARRRRLPADAGPPPAARHPGGRDLHRLLIHRHGARPGRRRPHPLLRRIEGMDRYRP